jgi:hypothetical protein
MQKLTGELFIHAFSLEKLEDGGVLSKKDCFCEGIKGKLSPIYECKLLKSLALCQCFVPHTSKRASEKDTPSTIRPTKAIIQTPKVGNGFCPVDANIFGSHLVFHKTHQ